MTLSDSPASDGREWAARHQAAGPGAINAAAREGFEHGFLSVPFEVQLLECETNAIAPYLREYLPMDGLILEAGSGSGRCVEWLHREGRQTIGLDWSPRLCAVAASHSKGGHFLAAAAEAMRRILIDKARRKHRVRHGQGLTRVDFDQVDLAIAMDDDTLVQVDEALEHLAREDRVKAELVKLRFFVGLSIPEAGCALGLSESTAKRYWNYARAWLYAELSRPR